MLKYEKIVRLLDDSVETETGRIIHVGDRTCDIPCDENYAVGDEIMFEDIPDEKRIIVIMVIHDEVI